MTLLISHFFSSLPFRFSRTRRAAFNYTQWGLLLHRSALTMSTTVKFFLTSGRSSVDQDNLEEAFFPEFLTIMIALGPRGPFSPVEPEGD